MQRISMPDHWTEDMRRRALPSAVTSAVLRSYVGETTEIIKRSGEGLTGYRVMPATLSSLGELAGPSRKVLTG